MPNPINLRDECEALFAERGIAFREEFVEMVDILISRKMSKVEEIMKKRDAELAEIIVEQKVAKDERKDLRDGHRELLDGQHKLQERLERAEKRIENDRREYQQEIRGLRTRLFRTASSIPTAQ